MSTHTVIEQALAAAVATTPQERLYVVADLAMRPDALQTITGARRPASARCLMSPAAGAGVDDVAPWLVELGWTDELPHSRLHASVSIAVDVPALSWIVSPLSAVELAARLVRRLDVELQGGQTMLLRWYDPRILPELHAVLHDEQRSAFEAVGSRWCWVERGSDLRVLELYGAPPQDPMAATLQLDQTQEDRLIWVSEREQFIAELSQHMPDAFHVRPPRQRAAWVEQWMRQSLQSGLAAHADQLLLMCLALTHGDEFPQRSPWRDAWPQVTSGRLSLREALARCERSSAA